MGRRKKLTPEAREAFVMALKAGAFLEVAARHAGWSPATMYRYLRDDGPANDGFREEVQRALTDLELRVTGTLTRAALTNPRWAVILLERRFPQRWGRNAGPEGDSEEAAAVASPVAEAPVVLDPALLATLVPRLLDAAAQLRAGGQPPPDASVDRFEERGDADADAAGGGEP